MPDHPREYGENWFGARAGLSTTGSSPRIRGEYDIMIFPHEHVRIIPANTGRILVAPSATPLTWDHPREYGENSLTSNFDGGRPGSSPRIRGEYAGILYHGSFHRIIPANTGRMVWACCRSSLARDHPREYGENRSASSMNARSRGSSPRIRGECHIASG